MVLRALPLENTHRKSVFILRTTRSLWDRFYKAPCSLSDMRFSVLQTRQALKHWETLNFRFKLLRLLQTFAVSFKKKFKNLCTRAVFTALFNNMRTLQFKAQPTNAFFATVNQEFGSSSQLPTMLSELCPTIWFDYRTLGSSRKLGGAAEHLIDGSEKCICRLSFEF